MNIPIQTIHLFSPLDQKLIELLRSLKSADWNKSTRAKLWSVKDIASHLLDGNIRALSMSRDNYKDEKPPVLSSYKHLVDYLNQLNADWVKATKRLSPQLLIELLELTGKEYIQHLKNLDPFAPALFSVAWAGEDSSLNWFHIAREYTEKWHHQQQIREAVHGDNDTELLCQELYRPVLDTFMYALPHAYRNTHCENGSIIEITIRGEAGGNWFLLRKHDGWEHTKAGNQAVATITMDAAMVWKLFTKGISYDEARSTADIKGSLELGKPILSMVCVIA